MITVSSPSIDPYTSVRQNPKNYGKDMDITMTWTICYDLDLPVPASEKIGEEEKFQDN